MKLYFDGGCRPNPGVIEVAVVARGIVDHRPDAGTGTNNDAEWLALIHALIVAGRLGARDLELVGDSALIVGQANGNARCRGAGMIAHHARFTALRAGFGRVRVRWIQRSQNLAGIYLAKLHSGR